MALHINAKLHPTVLYTIVDAYERRSIDQHRVIGSLLGSIDNGVIEITNCFCVPHTESEEEVAVELDFATDMFELHRKVSPNDVIVGWFSTGHDILDHSLLIHDYYKRVATNPIHLTVDTTLQKGRLEYKCYTSVPIGIPGATQATMFARFPVELTSTAAEVVGVCALQRSVGTRTRQVELSSDLSEVSAAVTLLEPRLAQLTEYVEQVVAGEAVPDPAVGRALTAMVAQVPRMEPEQFNEMLNTNIKDLLAITYLSQLISLNAACNEKVTLFVGSNIAKEN